MPALALLFVGGASVLVCFLWVFCSSLLQADRVADKGAHFLKYHVLGEDTFTVLADRNAAPGEQLFEDYGDNDNALLAAYEGPVCMLRKCWCCLCDCVCRYANHHGFVAENNKFDCLTPILPDFRRSDTWGPVCCLCLFVCLCVRACLCVVC